MNDITIAPARTGHLTALREIELAAFETLRAAGAVSGEPTATSLEDLEHLSREGVLLVAFTADQQPVGFAGAQIVANWLHIAEMDVHPAWQRKGIGRQLLRALLSAGERRGLAGASLTTDRYAPFNAAFYASLGFEPIKEEALSPRLKSLIEAEAASGLDASRRIAMQRCY
ncbi:GNAT family N-acetyltransferase [Kosakonia cowanii]|uniref:GNAT family N-acetyltransferase n=1 Tax=Kosakonia cowanii TaxID=208223 RepID=UPI0025A9D56C|nr:GNAT family N-acetyltransferase [Kosakonia cowanii]MDM9615549.1 GNAT family N-acetyltransferase [Kosakonia cowanii]MDP4560909.1 GNAT family N-acetyltransferase [Kosakonia cowanii]